MAPAHKLERKVLGKLRTENQRLSTQCQSQAAELEHAKKVILKLFAKISDQNANHYKQNILFREKRTEYKGLINVFYLTFFHCNQVIDSELSEQDKVRVIGKMLQSIKKQS